ncbi:hypothetical protein E2C01_063331 [Portunus trituberculatus]|uniref:Uncharacterized protein n=1 Tax=Portunus trituberculatus TaxID=210409 RepID=A0A5B7HGS3_PORTR|nr:hypothetical protein [Portunus trituberculatus]
MHWWSLCVADPEKWCPGRQVEGGGIGGGCLVVEVGWRGEAVGGWEVERQAHITTYHSLYHGRSRPSVNLFFTGLTWESLWITWKYARRKCEERCAMVVMCGGEKRGLK